MEDIEALVDQAEVSKIEYGEYALSVWSVPGATHEEIVAVARTNGAIPNRKVRVSTVERVCALGCKLVQSQFDGHYELVLPGSPDDMDWEALIDAFDGPYPSEAD